MSNSSTEFTLALKIDYGMLNALMDQFLRGHREELTQMIGKCLTIGGQNLQEQEIIAKPHPLPQHDVTLKDHRVDNKPLIGDTIPEDPFSSMFNVRNANANTTRIGDRHGK